MFNFGKNIISGIRNALFGKKRFSRENINNYIPERLKRQTRAPRKGISRALVSAISVGVGIAGVIAGIGIAKIMKKNRTKKAVVIVGEGIKPGINSNGFNGYLLKYSDIESLDTMADTLAANDFSELVIVPMTLINGYQTEKIKSIMAYKREFFDKITYAPALLSSDSDYEYVARTLTACVKGSDEDTAVVYVGRGTTHHANSAYIALNERFRRIGADNIFVGTVSSYPDFDKIMSDVSTAHYQNIILCPLEMTVDADLKADISEGDGSWYAKLTDAGFNCGFYMKGLCAYKGIRRLVIEHTRASM